MRAKSLKGYKPSSAKSQPVQDPEPETATETETEPEPKPESKAETEPWRKPASRKGKEMQKL